MWIQSLIALLSLDLVLANCIHGTLTDVGDCLCFVPFFGIACDIPAVASFRIGDQLYLEWAISDDDLWLRFGSPNDWTGMILEPGVDGMSPSGEISDCWLGIGSTVIDAYSPSTVIPISDDSDNLSNRQLRTTSSGWRYFSFHRKLISSDTQHDLPIHVDNWQLISWASGAISSDGTPVMHTFSDIGRIRVHWSEGRVVVLNSGIGFGPVITVPLAIFGIAAVLCSLISLSRTRGGSLFHRPCSSLPNISVVPNHNTNYPTWLWHSIKFATRTLTFSEHILIIIYSCMMVSAIAISVRSYATLALSWTYVFGHLTALHLSLSLLSSTQLSLLLSIFGIEWPSAIRWHRRCGRMTWLMLFVHAVSQLTLWGPERLTDLSPTYWGSGVLFGTLSGVTLTVIALSSLNWFRRRRYDWFYRIHAVGGPIAAAFAMIHSGVATILLYVSSNLLLDCFVLIILATADCSHFRFGF